MKAFIARNSADLIGGLLVLTILGAVEFPVLRIIAIPWLVAGAVMVAWEQCRG